MTVDSQAVSRFFLVIGFLFFGVVFAVAMVTNPTGSIAALVPVIATVLTLVALIKPRTGLFCLAGLVIWVDEFKRLAVYFGGTYSITVVQTLAMPFIVLAGLNLGFFLSAAFGRVKIDKLAYLIFAMGGSIGLAIFVTMDASFEERAQRAANIAGYISLIPIAYTYLKTFEDWRNFIGFQALVAFPAAAWAIKQYFFGFDSIEYAYAASGLSRVHYSQMFLIQNPRVFGFFGSASALGCVALYFPFSAWHAITVKKHRILWVLISITYFVVLIVSTQRTSLLFPFLIIPFVFAFRRPLTTFAIYIFGGIVFVAGVIASDWLLETGLDKINDAIAVEGSWGQQVLRVSTFSDRLRGWQRLKRAKSYSLFGTGKQDYSSTTLGYDLNGEDYNHDIINKILINTGVAGVLAIALPGMFLVFSLHNSTFKQTDQELRNGSAFALALILPTIGLSFAGGDNLNANPINLQTWTILAGVFVCRRQMLAQRKANIFNKEVSADVEHESKSLPSPRYLRGFN